MSKIMKRETLLTTKTVSGKELAGLVFLDLRDMVPAESPWKLRAWKSEDDDKPYYLKDSREERNKHMMV